MSSPRRFATLAVTGTVPTGDGQELIVSAGVEGGETPTRYLEFAQGDETHRVRISWEIDTVGRRRDADGRFLATLSIDGQEAQAVEVGSGHLVQASGKRENREAYVPLGLEWLGESLLAIASRSNGAIDGFSGGARTIAQAAKSGGGDALTDAAGCLADTAGAGAAIGSGVGAVVGSTAGGVGTVPGAGAGAAVGGAIGGAFGFGYCVVGPVLDGIWDWIFD